MDDTFLAPGDSARLKGLRESIDKYRLKTEQVVRLPAEATELGPAEITQLCAVLSSLLDVITSIRTDENATVREVQYCFTALSELWGRWITVRKDKPQFNDILKEQAARQVHYSGAEEDGDTFSKKVFNVYLKLIERSVVDTRISRDVILPYIRVITEREKNLHLAKILLKKPESPVYKLFVHELVLSLLAYPPAKVYKAYHLLAESPGQQPEDLKNVIDFLTDMYPKKYLADPHGANECVIRLHFSTNQWDSGMDHLSKLLDHGFYHHAETFEDFLSHFYTDVLDSADEGRAADPEKSQKKEEWVLAQLERLYVDVKDEQNALEKWNVSYERIKTRPELAQKAEESFQKAQNREKERDFCKNCGQNGATKRCSSCKEAIYCSKECQAFDWKNNNHKDNCVKK